MSYLDKLLHGVEVEWKTLGEVCILSRGRVMSKEYLAENAGEYPVYSSQTANNGEIGKIKTFDHDGEAVTWTTDGANAGTVFHRTGKFSITNVCGLIKVKNIEELNYKFLFYWLSIEAKKHVYSGMGNPKLMSNQMAKIPIPIPPLSVQKEIVRILDSFTELTAELTSELTARKKQYDYYREKLLSFEEGDVEWKPLGEVCDFQNGFAFQSNLFKDSGLPIVRITNINGVNVDLSDVKYFSPDDYNSGNPLNYAIVKGDILIAMSGATTGKIGYYNLDEKAYLNQRVGKFIPNKELLNNRFLFHFLLTKNEFLYVLAGGGAQPNLSSNAIKEKLLIPIPPLSEQERIVAILDKFDVLTTSISEGLPREIELRKKQYEYYRDLLLTFPKNNI